MLFLLNALQGEDGFPGAKGDLGIKGDRVSTASRFTSLRTIFILIYSPMEDKISTCVLILNLCFRVMMEQQVPVEKMDQKGRRVKLDPWEMREVLGYLVRR